MAKSSLLDGFAYGVLNEIIATFREQDGGYARPARYEVIIGPPKTQTTETLNLKAYTDFLKENKKIIRKTSLEMTQVAFPAMTLESQEDTNIYGPPRKIVTGQTFAEVATNIRCSADMAEKGFMDAWQRIAANRHDFSVGYYADYVGNMQIFQLDQENKRRFGIELVECYPATVGEIALDYGATNSISVLPVTWAYRYWKNLTDEAELPRPLLERIGDVFVNTVERQLRSRRPAVLRKL